MNHSGVKFRKLEDVWDLLSLEDKDLISAGLEKLINPKKEISIHDSSMPRLGELFNFTFNNF